MTRVDRHDKMLERTFWKYRIYKTHNTTSCTHKPHYAHTHTHHIMHTHTPHYAHITVIPNHLDAQDFNTQQS